MKRSKRQLLTIKRKDYTQIPICVSTDKPTNQGCIENGKQQMSTALNTKVLLSNGEELKVYAEKENDAFKQSIHIDFDTTQLYSRNSDIPIGNSKNFQITPIAKEDVHRLETCFLSVCHNNVLQTAHFRCCFRNRLKTYVIILRMNNSTDFLVYKKLQRH